jgi:hypothetical protein
MGARQELAQLLAELKNTRSPVGRVKLIARGWEIVRGLDRNQRQELAQQLGIDGAEDWLDRSAGARRLDRPWLEKLLRKARTLEVEELRGRARSLRDPEARRELLRRGVGALTDEFSAAEDATSPGIVEAEGPEAVQETPPPPVSEPPLSDVPEPGTGAPAAVTQPATIVPAPATGTPTPKTVEPVRAAPAMAAVPVSMADRPSAAETPPEPPPPAPARVGSAAEIVDRIRNTTRLGHRFRLLRRHLDDLREASPDQLRALIQGFPGGWARRRALASLLRRRIPDSLHRALFLIESLETDISRRWCVGTLLSYWNLSPAERESLIERHHLLRFRARRRAKKSVTDRVAPPV